MKLITTEEFYQSSPDDLPWVIDPFAVTGSMLLVYGRQGIGKSSLMWQLAHSLTTGVPWLGHHVLKTGPVVYLNLDMPHLEFKQMLERATAAGMPPTDRILMPAIGETESFDILKASLSLEEACAAVKPIALIVDTVADAYLPGGIRDINAEVRAVIARFRRMVPSGVLVLMLHDRKRSAFRSLEDNENDADAFNGPSAWEAKATSSFRLTSSKNGVKFHIKKMRLDAIPYDEMALERTRHGFFETPDTPFNGLMAWSGTATTLNDVFEDVGTKYRTHSDTIKKMYYRAVKKGFVFPWAAGVTKG
jgi:RecA-family ATPase